VTLPLALDAYTTEWLNLLVRGLHVVAGIAWIGSSFYFIALDLKLGRPAGEDAERRGVGGEAWEVHGGGFYHVQKYRVAPPVLPERLLWFKWEAYATWLSGFALLVVLYYANADAYLIDPGVADVSTGIAIGASVAILVAGWLAYDLLCRTLARSDAALALAVVAGTIGLAYGAGELFSARGAYIQVGATLGTLMAGNVLFVIIPGHWELVRAKRAGREPDPVHGIRGKQRSVHNNYLTLPVVFTMIANHFPSTFGHERAWAVLVAIMLVGALVRLYFNRRHAGRSQPVLLLAAAVAIGLVAFWVRPHEADEAAAPSPASVEAGRAVYASAGCGMCHTLADAGSTGGIGPKLDASAPSPALVRDRVRNGQGAMPAFAGRLTDQEIDAVAAYVSVAAGR
jgi:uncharacterized membrane protein